MKDHSFYTHFTVAPKKPHSFYEHQLTQNYKKYTPANMFLVGVRKNIYTAPFLDAQELHSRRIGKQMSVYSRKCSLEIFGSRDVENFYLVGV